MLQKITETGIKAQLKMTEWGLMAKNKLTNLFHDERGEVNVVAIVVLIGVAVALALLFRDAISNLLKTLLQTIDTKAQNAVNGP